MGLETRQGGNFFTIYQGKFCQRVQAGTPGSKERTNMNDKVVHEKFYDSFTGKLVGIKTQEGQYGKTWVLSFKDQGTVYNLQLPYSSSYAVAFLKMLPNIDLTKEMKVSPSLKEENGKKKSALFINQDGSPIKHAYTKDAPNGLPDLKKVKIKGQDAWDDTDRLEFLEAMVNKDIVPQLEGVPETSASEESPVEKEFNAIGESDVVDTEDESF